MRGLILSAAALALIPACAAAQTAPQPAKAAAPVAADPARIAAARQVVLKLMPEGIYSEMFRSMFGDVMDTMMGSFGDMPAAEVMRLGGLDEAQVKAMGEGRVREIMEIYDPNWHVRLKATTDAMGEMMAELMVDLEPKMREALANAYAREFDLQDLGEMNRFFSTPAGSRYAAKSMTIFMSPEMMASMGEMMPEVMKRMPDMMALVEAATADIPPARKPSELDPKDRKRLAELLGVPEDKLTDPAEEAEGGLPAETPH